MTDDDVKLRECPFCDGASSRRSTDEAGNKWVVCDDCGGRAYEMDWNRRPNSSSPDGRMREATIEECAKVADEWKDRADRLLTGVAADRAFQASQAIAARIRSLSPNSEPVHNPDSPKPLSDKDAFDIQDKPKDSR